MRSALRILFFIGLLALSGWAAAQTVEYIHTDALGSIVAITDESGNVIERREYEPYGAQLAPVIQDGPGYTGHVQDAATGLAYMQQRYYDPEIPRFLSVDPVTADSNPVGAFNRYWYANNNPYRFVDLDGRQACGKDTTCRLAQGEAGGIIGQIPHASVGDSRQARLSSNSSTSSSWDGALERVGLKGDLTKNGNILDYKSIAHDIFYPLMDSPGGSGFKAASLGALALAMRAEGSIVFRTGHYASRLEKVGLDVSRTEAIVAREVARIRPNMVVGADAVGRMRMNGVLVEYRVRALPDGKVNVGTIFPVD